MFQELNTLERLHSYNYYPPASERSAYLKLPKDFTDKVISEGEKYLGFSFPAIPATVYMSFLRTGNRVAFEDINFQKRYALNALIMAECVEYKGRFVDDIVNGIFSICEESAWQLPPHNSYPGLPNQLLPDVTTPVLDLFACETGALLATAYHLLKDAFDKVHPFINKRILHEIDTRILTPYITKHFWWMGNMRDKMCNWTIWCTQNILITAFLSEQTDEIRKQVFDKACTSIDDFLKDYGIDGCCDEGAQYFRHAGLCLFNAMEIINNITNGEITDFYRDFKIRAIAIYIMNVHVHDIYYVNFADCSPVAGRAGVREFLFAKRMGSSAMQGFAAKEFAADEDKLLSNEINLFYRLQNMFTFEEISSYPAIKPAYMDIYYESVGLLVARDDTFVLAAKAGHNADSHNHNDTGSVTIYKDGKPFLIDVGVETYTKQTFSGDRYKLWTMQSAYHNLPTINGVMQKDGREYAASDVTFDFSNEHSILSMDIAGAYPKEAGIRKYHRTVTLNKGSNITIEDAFSFENPDADNEVALSLMTYETPEISDNIISVGELGTIRVDCENIADIVTEEIPITDARLGVAWKHSIYRTRVSVHGNFANLIIS